MFITTGQTAHAQVTSLPAEINKRFSPISIAVGAVSQLRVNIYNPNTFQLTNAAWLDNLVSIQPGLSIANPIGLTNTCGGTVTAVAGTTTLSLNGGTVPAQSGITPGSCTVTINVTSTIPGNLINTIPTGALTSTGGGVNISNTTPASATLNVIGTQPPSVSKSFNPGTILAGGVTQLSILINNNDPTTTLTQTTLADNLPANIFLANPFSPTLNGCGASATLTASPTLTAVTLNNGTIAPNSTCTIVVNVTSNVQGGYTNRIPAKSLQTAQNLTNASEATYWLNVEEIGLLKRFSPSTLTAGGTSILTITLQNPTGSPYTNVGVSDTLPGTVLAIVPGSATTTCGGTASATPPQTVALTGGTIPPGNATTPGTCTISVQVTVPAGTPSGSFTNTIPENTITNDQSVGNLRPATAAITVNGTDILGAKTFSPASIIPGGNSLLRIDVFAPSDTNLTNYSITDNLPLGVTVSNSTAPTITGCGTTAVFTAPTGAASISLTNGMILAGQRCRIDVYVTSSTPGLHVNTIPPANITNNENRAPASDLTSGLTVTTNPNLSIQLVKGFNPLTVFGGSASTMSIQLINPGNVALTGITFPDTMPTGMIIANPPNPDVGTCGGAIPAVAGTSSFTFSGGSLPPFGNCTLTLSVTMTVNGNLTNGIPARAITTTQGATNPQPAEASLTNLPGVSINKFFSPNPVTTGSYSAITITIQNTSNISLTGMGLGDPLPTGLQIAGAGAPAPTSSCGGTLTAVAGTQLIQLTNGSLGASLSCTIAVNVIANVTGNYQNVIAPQTLTSDQNVTNIASATDTLVVQSNVSGLTKIITNSDLSSTTGTNMAIGEIVTYQVSISVPPGTHLNTSLVDTMDRGLAFIGCDVINATGLTTSMAGGFASICSTPTTSNPGGTSIDIDRQVTYDFGTLTNNSQADIPLTLTYRAIVLDIGTNTNGINLRNSALWTSDTNPLGPVQTAVQIAEPELVVQKTANVNFIANGSEVTFTLAVSHTQSSHSDAFDVLLIDALPAGLDFVANSLDCATGQQDPNTCTYNPATRTITATWNAFTRLPAGDQGIVQFRAIGNASIPANGSVTNTATVEWTSQPGDHSTPQSFSAIDNPFAIERGYDPLNNVIIYSNNSSLTFTPLGNGNGGGNGNNSGNNNKKTTAKPSIVNGFLIPVTGFAPNAQTILTTNNRPIYNSTSVSLEIPALKVNTSIVGVKLQNGSWDVSWLQNQIGWLNGTAYPTWNGNSVLTGHAVNVDGKPGIFSKLKYLQAGEYIFVYNSGYRYTYKVISNKSVQRNDISVLKHQERAYLTLITCDNYDVKSSTYLNRIAVSAVLIDTQAIK